MPGPKPLPEATPEQVERIKRARIALGLTQTDLAHMVGCTPGAASQWFGGKGRFPQVRADEVESALADYALENLADVQTTQEFVLSLVKQSSWKQPAKGKAGGEK